MTKSNNIGLVEAVSSRPLVTIAIPTYNRAKFLGDAINSALAQTYETIEVVVSDNASTDETEKVLESYRDDRLRYVRQQSNIGMIGNWNACLNLAQGIYFMLLSDDDQLKPKAIQELLKRFDRYQDDDVSVASSEVAFVYGLCEINNIARKNIFISKSAPPVEKSEDYRIGFMRSQRVNYPSATLFRTQDMRVLGGYRSDYGYATDIGMAFEISGRYRVVANAGIVTTYYLFHPNNLSSASSESYWLNGIRVLTSSAVSLVDPLDVKLLRETKKAGVMMIAASLVRSTVESNIAGASNIVEALKKLWLHRILFRNVECIWVLVKGVTRLLLARDLMFMTKRCR